MRPYVAAGAVLSIVLNALLVPRFGVAGAICAGSVAFAAIDLLCIGSLRAPLSTGALLRLFLSLGGSLGVAAGVTAVLASRGFSPWPQAIVFASAFAVLGALSYRYRHGRADTFQQFPGGLA